MNITLVADRLNWGGHHNIEYVVEVCKDKHDFTVVDLLGLSQDHVKDADLVMGWIDSTEEAIYRLWKEHKFPFASRVTGWKSIYRTIRYPRHIKDAIIGVTCCSQELAIAARRIYPTDLVECIPVGVDTEAFKPAERLGKGWAWIGRRKDSQKDEDMMKRVRWRVRNVKLRTQKWRGKKVVPTNWPEDMVEFYQGCRGFFRTSRLEGSSNCLLEAMSCGIPVLATPTGVAFRIVDPMWLMMDPRHFIRAIKLLNDDDELAIATGRQNRETILDGWTIQDRREPWLSFFEECVKR